MKRTMKSMAYTFGILMASTGIAAAAECEVLTLGSAISLTGKYATNGAHAKNGYDCLLYTSPSPRDQRGSRMPSSA